MIIEGLLVAFVVGIGLLFVAGGAALIKGVGGHLWERWAAFFAAHDSQRWVATTGKVTRSVVTYTTFRRGRSFAPVVRYAYSVGGESFVSERFAFVVTESGGCIWLVGGSDAILSTVGRPERKARATRWTATGGLLLVAVLAAGGCGGQSLGHADDDGVGGAPDGGTSGTGTAGTSIAGTSSGGAPTGGTAGASTGGAAGICALPIEPGPCLAYAPSFGFSAADGNCQPFVYGGCEGNPNRFSTLAECEAQCGGGTLSRCPPTVPSTAQGGCALGAALLCAYDEVGCLCAPRSDGSCNRIDPDCGNVQAIPPEGGARPPSGDRIVCRAYTLCSCGSVTTDAPAGWMCQPGCGTAP